MAKLVDLLAKYLVEWPKGCEIIVQDDDKECKPCGCECADIESNGFWIRDSPLGSCFYLNELASDWDTAKVTYGQWISARDRLHAETLKDMKVVGAIESLEFDTVQELWDKVAVSAMQSLMPTYWDTIEQYDSADQMVKCHIESAFDYADAFMAERAKRLKGCM